MLNTFNLNNFETCKKKNNCILKFPAKSAKTNKSTTLKRLKL